MNRKSLLYSLECGCMAVMLFAGCIRDAIEPCPPLAIRLEVTDKNYVNVKAAHRLGLEEIRDENLPFRAYVSDLCYQLTNVETGEKVFSRELSPVEGDDLVLAIPVPEEIPFGRYVLTAWGNVSNAALLEPDATRIGLHPDNLPGTDVYLASDTLEYNENDYTYTVGMKRTKGKLIVEVVDMPDEFRYSEKEISDIRSEVNSRFDYDGALDFLLATVWQQPNEIVTKTLLAPSTGAKHSLCRFRFYVGNSREDDNWIAPEEVSITMARNELTILRYVYDRCCCCFKIYILINDNWEALHRMEIV